MQHVAACTPTCKPTVSCGTQCQPAAASQTRVPPGHHPSSLAHLRLNRGAHSQADGACLPACLAHTLQCRHIRRSARIYSAANASTLQCRHRTIRHSCRQPPSTRLRPHTCGVHAAAHHRAYDVHQPRQLPLKHLELLQVLHSWRALLDGLVARRLRPAWHFGLSLATPAKRCHSLTLPRCRRELGWNLRAVRRSV